MEAMVQRSRGYEDCSMVCSAEMSALSRVQGQPLERAAGLLDLDKQPVDSLQPNLKPEYTALYYKGLLHHPPMGPATDIPTQKSTAHT